MPNAGLHRCRAGFETRPEPVLGPRPRVRALRGPRVNSARTRGASARGKPLMALKELLILRRLAPPGTARRAGRPGGGREGRTALIQLDYSLAGRDLMSAMIGVGSADWVRHPLPPNRTCGSPASGSPVDGSPARGLADLRIGVPQGEKPMRSKEGNGSPAVSRYALAAVDPGNEGRQHPLCPHLRFGAQFRGAPDRPLRRRDACLRRQCRD